MIRIPKKIAIDNNLPYKLFACQFMIYEDKPLYLGIPEDSHYNINNKILKIIGVVDMDNFAVLSYNKRLE